MKRPQCSVCYEGLIVKQKLKNDYVYFCDRCFTEVNIDELGESYKQRHTFT